MINLTAEHPDLFNDAAIGVLKKKKEKRDNAQKILDNAKAAIGRKLKRKILAAVSPKKRAFLNQPVRDSDDQHRGPATVLEDAIKRLVDNVNFSNPEKAWTGDFLFKVDNSEAARSDGWPVEIPELGCAMRYKYGTPSGLVVFECTHL